MKFNLYILETFEKAAKPLQKKYPSFKQDMEAFYHELTDNPDCGDSLGGGIRKIRLAIASKNKGKSGSARIISYDVYLNVCEKNIYLLTIYDKSKQDSILPTAIKILLQKNGFVS